MKNFIPICFYPTRKILLDDDSIFSESILLKMEDKFFSSYTSPYNLLNYLLKKYSPVIKQADLFEPESTDYELSMHRNFHIPRKKFNSIVENTLPQDISVILVDYHMPSMTGIDFLNQIKSLPFKKILITGEQNYAIGIDALNTGLIDAYIRKDDPNLLNKLNNLITILEWKYFTDLSASVYNFPDLDYLANSSFIEKFEQFIDKNKIAAFFLENKEGDFSLFDNSERNFIVVRSKKQLQDLSTLAKEDGASKEIVNHLERAEVIPFFGNKQYWEIPASEWGKFLYPAQLLTEESNFVWTVISNHSLYKSNS
jgi:CheY-like chemotaxis protein